MRTQHKTLMVCCNPTSVLDFSIVVFQLLDISSGYRIYVPRTSPIQNITYSPFEPYENGFVGYFGDSTNYQRERINEGSPNSASHSIQVEDVNPRQVCPSMVGPFSGGKYYCRGREYGYCDRRSGACFCNMGYQGVDCGECTNTHFQVGSLCYPKKLCSADCSGHGNCDYTIGNCVCEGGFWGEDCSKVNCGRFDELCMRCSNTTCTTCAQGYSVQKNENSTRCLPCSRFDPRCSECDNNQCLECADPLLSSARRSGYRHLDAPLLWDEQTRDLSVELPFGSQSPRAFVDSEAFMVVTDNNTPLQDKATVCHQGEGMHGGENDASWTCNSTMITHLVCGHPGTVSFASPTYSVSEGNGFVAVTVVRSGGGHGALEVSYSLSHINTDDDDVTLTAPYTTSTLLPFFDGCVSLTFKVMIHDDRVFEGDERFVLSLHEATGSSSSLSLGSQASCVVTIIDNDQPLTGYENSKVTGDLDCVAGIWCPFTITAHSSTGLAQFSGGDSWLAIITNTEESRKTVLEKALVTDHGNGTYTGLWRTETQGSYFLRVFLAVGGGVSSLKEEGGLRRDRYAASAYNSSSGSNGGLQGTYFNSPFLEPGTEVMRRVDASVNFTWGLGPLTATASDFVTIRWEGAIRFPSEHEEEVELSVICDDGVRLWIDRRLVIDEWDTESDTRESSALVPMNPQLFYHVILEYRELAQDAFIRFQWKWSGLDEPQVIPQASLYHLYEVGDTQPPVMMPAARGGFKGRGIWSQVKQPLKGKKVRVVSAETNSEVSDCVGTGLITGIAGQEHTFTIRPRDKFGNLRNDESLTALRNDPFEATALLMDDSPFLLRSVPVSLTYDISNHEVKASYTPTISGNYALSVLHSSSKDTYVEFGDSDMEWPSSRNHLYGSPFNVTTHPTLTFARRCDFWEVDHLDSWNVGEVHRLLVRARDQYGNLRMEGGDEFQVVAFLNRAGVSINHNIDELGDEVDFGKKSILAESIFGEVRDLGKGNYSISLRPIKKGDYTLAIYLNGHHVARSPYDAHCQVGVAQAAASVAIGRGLYTARATFTSSFTFQARDAFSNDLEGDFGGPNNTLWSLVGSITSPGSDLPINVSSLHDGTAIAFFTPDVAGESLLSIYLDIDGEQEHISGSPFTIRVADGPVVGSQSVASGTGVHFGIAGKTNMFLVQARDPFGNARSDDGDRGVNYTDGRLNYNRQDVVGADPGDQDLFNATLVLTTPFNAVHTPAFRGVVYRGPTTFRGQDTYIGDGIHRIEYNATATGMYNLSVLAFSSSNGTDKASGFTDGMHIRGSPFLTYIAPTSASARLSLVWGHGLKDQVAGITQRVNVQTVDLFGNNLTSGGDLIKVHVALNEASYNGSFGRIFNSPLDTPASAYRPVVSNDVLGRYKSSYVPLVSGSYTARAVLFQRGGLDGTYFGSSEFTRPLETRQDELIDFNWGLYQYNSPTNSLPDDKIMVATESTTATTTVIIDHDLKNESSKPLGSAPVDSWSVRWSGYLLSPLWEEEMTLYVDIGSAEDSVAVFLDGHALIGGNAWDTFTGTHTPFTYMDNGDGDVVEPITEFTDVAIENSPPSVGERLVHADKIISKRKATTLMFEEQLRTFEEIRYAFPDEMMHPNKSYFSSDTGSMTNATEIWRTHPENSSLADASLLAASASGFRTYANSFFFPRQNEPHALEVVYRHLVGNASLSLSWSSSSMKKARIPSSHFLRPLPISGTSYDLTVRPAPTHPGSSSAVGEGLHKGVAGVASVFTVEARDEWGNLRLTGGDVVSAVAKGPGVATFTCDVFDLNDGRYNVSCSPMVAGLYSLSVTVGSSGVHPDFGYFSVEESLANAHVVGSPFQLRIHPGATQGAACAAYGDATMKAAVGVGVSGRGANSTAEAFLGDNGGASFVIIAKDKHHNYRRTGGDAFDVKLIPRSHMMNAGVDNSSVGFGVVEETITRSEVGQVEDIGDGTYRATYSSANSGYFDLYVRSRPKSDLGLSATYFDNHLLQGAPLELVSRTASNGAVTEYSIPSTSRIENPPQFDTWSVLVENFASSYDSNSKLLGGADDIRRLTTLKSVPKAARWVGYLSVPITESYNFSVRASAAGLEGRVFVNENLTVRVESFTGINSDDRHSPSPIFLKEGRLYPVRIEVVGATGDFSLCWQSDRVPFQTIPSFHFHPPTVPADATEREEISEEAQLFAAREAALLGEHIMGSPFSVYLSPGRPFAPNCVALGLGRGFQDSKPLSFYGYMNQSALIEIRAHDVFGNLLDHGGADWYVRVVLNQPYRRSPDSYENEQTFKIYPKDHLNGSYTVSFTPFSHEESQTNSSTSNLKSYAEYTIEVLLAIPAYTSVVGYGADGSGSAGDQELEEYYSGEQSGVVPSLLARGGGLKAEYFTNPALDGRAEIIRIDPVPNLQLPLDGTTSYSISQWPLLQARDASVRYSGLVKAPHSGVFSLSVSADAGNSLLSFALFVDEIQVLSETQLDDNVQVTAQVPWTDGVLYKIQLQVMIEVNSGTSTNESPNCRLEWKSDRIPNQLIPSSYLYPSASKISDAPFLFRAYS